MKGGRFGIFQHPFCRKTPKTLKGDPLRKNNFQEKKSGNAEKTERGTLWSRPVFCYAGNLFGSVPWANRYILASSENFVELLVELFWSVQVVLKNTDEKP